MNGFDFISVYLLITFLAFWIDGLSHELPPEKCRLFFLNATAKYHEENKPPTMEDLKKIIPILIVPYDLSTPKFRCNETTVTLQNVTFTSSRALNETRLDLVFKIEPKKNLTKHWAYLCAENMLDQGSDKFREVERFLRLRNDDMSAPFYVVDQKACCEDQHLYYEPCCRKEYTLRNLTCVKDLERENDSQKGDVAKMERETGRDNCEPSGPLSVGIIIIIICASLILFVTIILVGLRVWKHKHRPNRSGYDDVPDVITTEGQSEERRDTGESTSGQNVAVPVKEETIDGYMRMQNLSQTNLIERNTRPTSITTTTTNNNNNNHNTRTSSNNESGQNSPLRSKSPNRPISRAEMLFNFDKHIPIEAIDFTNKMLGRGQFGQVELAYATISGIRKKCAVKMIRGRLAIREFEQENEVGRRRRG